MMSQLLLRLFCFTLLIPLFGACVPKVYVIDRQTVLEDEAAGEWPEFERELLKKSKAHGPTPFSKVEMSKSRARLYNVLNGSLASDTEESNKDRQ